MKPIEWTDFPLPLIQVNPPNLSVTNDWVAKAYANGIFTNSGEIQREASKILSKHVNSEFEGYLAASNTAALVSCLIACNVRGKHVVISNFTFAATVNAVILAGGIPVVCDIDEDNLVMSFTSLRRILESGFFDIAAVLPTRVLGFVSDLSSLVALCSQKEIPVIVDSAACFPASEGSWNFERQAKYEVFSLHATKVFGIGEGGIIVGREDDIEKVRKHSNFGIALDGSYRFEDGLNAKADEFVSARALARFPEYASDVEARKSFIQRYEKVFRESELVDFLPGDFRTIYSYFPVIFNSEASLVIFQKYVEKYITTRRYYFPSIQLGYTGNAQIAFDGALEVSNSISKRILCLPVYALSTEETNREIELLLIKSLEGLM